MASLDEHFRSLVPSIHYDIPKAEREAVREIGSWLDLLDWYVTDFYAALELFDYAETHLKSGFENIPVNPPPSTSMRPNFPMKWEFIAARDGAMTIRHFQKTMQAIRRSSNYAPSLYKQVDTDKLKLAERLFDSSFPQARRIRNIVGHAAETTMQPLERGDSKQQNVLVTHSLAGRRYTTDHQGETFTYELSEPNLGKLNNVKLRIFESFDLVNIHIRKTD